MFNKLLDLLIGHKWLIFNELQSDGSYKTIYVCKRCLKTCEYMIGIDINLIESEDKNGQSGNIEE